MNFSLKELLKERFIDWYAGLVFDALKRHPEDVKAAVAEAQPGLKMSVMKPPHANWTIQSFAQASLKVDLIKASASWRDCGITRVFSSDGNAGEDLLVISKWDKQSFKLSTAVADLTVAYKHFLPSTICQSRLNGRKGSSACVLIALLVIISRVP